MNSRPITDSRSAIQLVGKSSGEARENPTTEIEVVDRDSVNYSYLGLLRFKNFCKKLLAAAFQGCLSLGFAVRRSGQDRPAHKLVNCVRAYLEFRLESRESFLRIGYREFRWDEQAVALRNAINFLNCAQASQQSCPCVYCAGAPFYASKKPVQSIGRVQAKAAGL